MPLPVGNGDAREFLDGPDAAQPVEPGGRYASLTRLRGLPGLPEFDNKTNLTDFGSYSWFPVAAITGTSRTPDVPRISQRAGLVRCSRKHR